MPVQVSPVGALEKGVGKADVGRVDALAQMIGKGPANGAVQGHDEIFSREAVRETRFDGVIAEVIVYGVVYTGVQVQVIKGDERLLVLRKGL